MPDNWQASVGREVLLLRAQMLEKIRYFMCERNILEVDTPILSATGIPDPNIQSLSTKLSNRQQSQPFYLSTSPEFCMKRLLVAGSGAIYQITKVFRDDEISRLHQPEFSMLEWYQPGYNHYNLMDEVSVLLVHLGLPEAGQSTYENAFLEYLDIDPHTASTAALRTLASSLGLREESNERSILLEFLFSHSVSPNLGQNKPLLLYHYPVCQAALARISTDHKPVAERFELFVNGMELANGFHELTDANEQRCRFESENKRRHQQGLAEVALDEEFLSALEAGLPACAGVALGLDRLLMVLARKQHINEVMTFPLGDA